MTDYGNRWMWCYTCKLRVPVDEHPKCHDPSQFVEKRKL